MHAAGNGCARKWAEIWTLFAEPEQIVGVPAPKNVIISVLQYMAKTVEIVDIGLTSAHEEQTVDIPVSGPWRTLRTSARLCKASIEEDMCDERKDEDLLIHSCEACIWHACEPCTRLKQLRLRFCQRDIITVFPTVDSCVILDVTPFGALHSMSKKKERLRGHFRGS